MSDWHEPSAKKSDSIGSGTFNGVARSGVSRASGQHADGHVDVRSGVSADVRADVGADAWADVDGAGSEQAFKALSRDEARALMARHPSTSPWRVVAVQAAVGAVLAVAVGLYSGVSGLVWSVLYGAATVVVPAALMARGMTSRLSSLTPGVSAVSFMLWEFGKMTVSVLMLMLAPKLVPDLNWPALLLVLIVCINLYWVALPWRRRSRS